MTAPNDILATNPEVVTQTALADWCALVAQLLRPPTAEHAAALREVSLVDDYRAITEEVGIGGAAVDELATELERLHGELAANNDALGTLRREHTRVFTHPKHPLVWPYEGVFCDSELEAAGHKSTESRLFINPAAMDCERRYKAAGYAESSMRFPADFISTQLEFMGLLHQGIAAAIVSGDVQGKASLEDQLADFKRTHGDTWMRRFFGRCQAECAPGYYQVVARMGLGLLDAEGVE